LLRKTASDASVPAHAEEIELPRRRAYSLIGAGGGR